MGFVKMDELNVILGAVYGWCRVKDFIEHVWGLMYWPALDFCGDPPQVDRIHAGGFWAGFMSEARGLNWDRKSRYGKK